MRQRLAEGLPRISQSLADELELGAVLGQIIAEDGLREFARLFTVAFGDVVHSFPLNL